MCTPDKMELRNLVQKKSLNWVCGNLDKDLMYNGQPWLLFILPFPLFLKLNFILFPIRLYQEKEQHKNELPESVEQGNLNEAYLILRKRKNKKRSKGEFFTVGAALPTERTVIDLYTFKGLENRVQNFMWKFVNERFPTTCVPGNYVATVETAEISGRYSEQMQNTDPAA